jgi:streptogramin lyase
VKRLPHLVTLALLSAAVACGASSSAAAPPEAVVVAKIPVGGNPCGVVEAAGAIWVSDAAAGKLVRIDPATNEAGERYDLAPLPCERRSARSGP